MKDFVWRALALVGFALMSGPNPASSQEAVRIRATIERVEGPTFIIKERDGTEQKLTLSDHPLFVAIVKSTVADIKPGMFVGSTGMSPTVAKKPSRSTYFRSQCAALARATTIGISSRKAK